MKQPSGSKKRPRSVAVPARAQSASLTPAQIALLRRNFAAIEPQSGIAALVFYRHLFALDPSLRALFHTSIELQGRKLMEALQFTIASLENPGELVPVLEAMGRRHVTYGTRNEHYVTVQQAMMQTLRESLGREFTPAAEKAWQAALGFVCETMLRGANEVQDLLSTPPTAAAGKAVKRRRAAAR